MAFNLQDFVKQQLTNALKRGASPSSLNSGAKQNSTPLTPARANPLSNYITDLMKVINEGNTKYQSPRKQYLSLLYNVIKYIVRNPSSSKELENLYQTFKNFISKRKILVPSQKCDFIGDTFIIKDERKDLRIKVRDIITWLNDNFYIEKIGLSVDSKFYECAFKKLVFVKIEMSFNEFDILVNENSIRCYKHFISRIHDSRNNYVPVDKILQKLPYITEFTYATAEEKYSLTTLQKLNSLCFCHKFDLIQLHLVMVDESFDPLMFCYFIEKNAGESTEATIWMKNNPQSVIDSMEAAINNMKQSWNGQKLSLHV